MMEKAYEKNNENSRLSSAFCESLFFGAMISRKQKVSR